MSTASLVIVTALILLALGAYTAEYHEDTRKYAAKKKRNRPYKR